MIDFLMTTIQLCKDYPVLQEKCMRLALFFCKFTFYENPVLATELFKNPLHPKTENSLAASIAT